MSVYLVTYDLRIPGRDYSALYKEIKSLGASARHMESTWFVDSTLSSNAIRDRLTRVMDANDYLFITRIADYSGRLPQEAWDWLMRYV